MNRQQQKKEAKESRDKSATFINMYLKCLFVCVREYDVINILFPVNQGFFVHLYAFDIDKVHYRLLLIELISIY